jgi:fibronectin type 3 domain-containing protein
MPRALSTGARRALAVLAVAGLSTLVAPHARASRLVISSALSSGVLRFDSHTGSFLDLMVPGGTGGLTYPDGMAFGPDGNLYVRSAGNVLRFNGTTGAFLGVFASGGGADPNSQAFQVRLDGGNAGNFVVTPASGGLDGPTGLAFGPDGNIYVSSYGLVLRYSGQTGLALGTFASGGGLTNANATGLAFGPDGNLYVTCYPGNKILRFDGTTGAFKDTFVAAGLGGLDRPIGLAFGPDNNLYVCSYNTDRVLRYNGQTGLFTGTAAAGSGLDGPTGVSFGPDGNLYVSSYLTDAVLRFNASTGVFIDYFIAPGSNGLDGPFSPVFLLEAPTGLAAAPTSTTQIALSWTDNSDDETGFEVDRKTGAGAYTPVAVIGPHSTSYLSGSLNPNTAYTFRVRAVYAGGSSLFSNESTASTLPDPPAAPTALSVAPGTAPNTLALTWADNSANETGFAIYRKFAGGDYSTTPVATMPANTTSYVDPGLSIDTVWTYKVQAIGDNGNSAFTNEAGATPLPPPPAAPTGLAATAISTTQINLTWTDNSNTPKTNFETAFSVWRKSGTADYQKVTDLPANTTAFSDTGLTPGTSYTYRVRALNQGGVSGWTNEVPVATPDVPPAPPTNLTATANSPTQVDLSWTDNSSNETSFSVWRKLGDGVYQKLADLPANTTVFSDKPLTSLTAYTYKVRATGQGGDSGFTLEVPVTTPDFPPAAPSGLTATASSPTQVDLSWTDNSSNETSFSVWRKLGDGTYQKVTDLPAKSTQFSDTGLTPVTAYTYKVRATGQGGDSAFTLEVPVTTPDVVPATPTALTATASSPTQVNLGWTDNSSNETSFSVWRKVGDGAYQKLADLPANSTAYSDTPLTPLTAYSYKVRATGPGGDSGFATEVSVTTPDFPPASPSGLTANASSPTQIDLTWTDNSGNETAFSVWRKVGNGAYQKLADLGANATTYSDTLLTPVTAYTYKVRATGQGGDSGFSVEVTATTPDFPPASPSGLTAAASSPTQVNLNWTDNSSNETGFAVWRKVGAGAYGKVADLGANTTTYADTTVSSLTTYSYKVQAVGTAGASDFSAEVPVTTPEVPPAAPTGMTAQIVSGTQVKLTWQDNSANEGSFNVWRKTGAGAYVKIAIVAPNTVSYLDGGLTAGTSYTYKVRAYGSTIGSSFSNEVTVVPEFLPAAPTGLTVKIVSGTQLRLAWQDNSTNEGSFDVWRKTGAGAYVKIAIVAPNTILYLDSGLTAGTSYTYKVRAYGRAGGSAFSNEATMVPDVPPAAPTGLAALPVSGSQIKLAWQDNSTNEGSFDVWRKTGDGTYMKIAIVAPNTVLYLDSGLTMGTSYTYKVRAYGSAGGSGFSNEVTLTTPVPPVAPTALAARPFSGTRVDLSWTDNSNNETGFAIWRKTGVGAYAQVALLGPDTTAYSDTSASPLTAYSYQVRAVGLAGASDPSNEATATTPVGASPAAPAGLIAAPFSTTQVGLMWSDNSDDETAFSIWRRTGAGDWARVTIVPPNTTSYTDNTVTPEQTYTYRVRAGNNSGVSAWTDEVTVSTASGPPADPSNLTLTVTSGQINLTWNDNSANETAFAIFRKGVDGVYVRIAVLAPNTTAYTDTSVTTGTAYTYRMRAVNNNGVSVWTSEVSGTTP